MPTIAHPRTLLWTALRGQLRHTRETLAARKALEREIAGYTSQSDLNDLHAILDRHTDHQAAEIRRILARHAA
jgi:hypothetical protein